MNLKSTIVLFGYGTSEGVTKEWDTRGRGRHTQESFGFVSPNTEENLTFQDAYQRLNSPQQQETIQKAQNFVNQVFVGGGKVTSAVGDWKDGAENSAVVEVTGQNKNLLDYAMATLGKQLNQKAVLSFTHDDNGKDALWTIHTGQDIQSVRNQLDVAGVNFRTLVPEQGGTTIHIFDSGTEMADKIGAVAQKLKGQIEVASGTGDFIGGDSREEAQKQYDKVISGYQKTRTVRANGVKRYFPRERRWHHRRQTTA